MAKLEILNAIQELTRSRLDKKMTKEDYLFQLNKIILNNFLSDKPILVFKKPKSKASKNTAEQAKKGKTGNVATWNMGCGKHWVENTCQVKASTNPRPRGCIAKNTPLIHSEVERLELCEAVIQSLHAVGYVKVFLQEGPSKKYIENNLKTEPTFDVLKLGIPNEGELGDVRNFISCSSIDSLQPPQSPEAQELKAFAIASHLDPKEYQILEDKNGQLCVNVHFEWAPMYIPVPEVPQACEKALNDRIVFLEKAYQAKAIIAGDTNFEERNKDEILKHFPSGLWQLNGGCSTMDVLMGEPLEKKLNLTSPLLMEPLSIYFDSFVSNSQREQAQPSEAPTPGFFQPQINIEASPAQPPSRPGSGKTE